MATPQQLDVTDLLLSINGDDLGVVPIVLKSGDSYPVTYDLNSSEISFSVADPLSLTGRYSDPLFCFDLSETTSPVVSLRVEDANGHTMIPGLEAASTLQYMTGAAELRLTPSFGVSCFYHGLNSGEFGLFGSEPFEPQKSRGPTSIFSDAFAGKVLKVEFQGLEQAYARAGTEIVYDLVISNASDEVLDNIGFQEVYPANADFFDATLSQTDWSCTEQDACSRLNSVNSAESLRFQGFSLAAGESATIEIRRTVDGTPGSVIDLYAAAVVGGSAEPHFDAAKAGITIVGDGASLVATASDNNEVNDPVTITATALDANTNPVPDLQVDLVADDGLFGTTLPLSETTDGSGQAMFITSTQDAGTYSLEFAAGTMQSAFTDVTVAAGPPSTMTATVLTDNIKADGSDEHVFELQVFDQYGNPVEPGETTVSVSNDGGLGLGNIDPDSAPVGANGKATFAATSTVADSFTVQFSAPLISSASATAVFEPGDPDPQGSTLAVAPESITTDGSSTVTVSLFDAEGNALDSGGDTVTINASFGSVSSVTDNGDGTYTASFTAAETSTATISAEVNDVTLTDTASVTVGAGNADPAQSTITASPETITAGGTATVTVQLKDSDGNNLTSGGESVGLGSDIGSFVGSVTDNGDGSYTGTFMSEQAGEATISGSVGGVGITDTATVAVESGPADPATSEVVADPETIATDASSTITVQLKDQYGNNVNLSNEAVLVGAIGPGNISAFGVQGGKVIATFEPDSTTSTGQSTVTATLDGTAITDTATVTITAGPADANASTIEANPSSEVIANGDASSTLTITVTDQYGNPVSGESLFFAITNGSAGTGGLSSGPWTTDINGEATASLTSTNANTIMVTGYIGSDGMGDELGSANVIFDPAAADATQSSIGAVPASNVVADGQEASTITLTVRDASGNLVSGQDVFFEISAGTGSSLGSSGPWSTDANGEATVALTATDANTIQVAGYLGTDNTGAFVDSASVDFVPGQADATQSIITAAPGSMTTDTSTAITVELRDQFGNPLTSGGDTVSLSTDRGSLTAIADNLNGTYSATLTSTSIGTATITGQLNATNMTDGASVTIDPGAANAGQSLVSADPGTIADGETSTVTVELRDQYGNPLTTGDDTVNFFQAAGSTGSGTLTATTDLGNGSYTTVFTAIGSGTAKVGANVNGQEIIDDAEITINP